MNNKSAEAHDFDELSFGSTPEETAHHFVVNTGSANAIHVCISEHFDLFENPERRRVEYDITPQDKAMRVVLSKEKWKLIDEAIRFEFNRRLKQAGAKTSRFKQGFNILPRLFGKELILLCWAIEDADPALIPIAIKNWQGLKPEERWWLFTMTNAATGQAVQGKNRGWRKAVRFALTENPVESQN